MKKFWLFFIISIITLCILSITAFAILKVVNLTLVSKDLNTSIQEEVKKEEILFTFNPHVYSKKLSESYSQDYWDSFYNLCDALRNGEDTFKCSSKEIYNWCIDPVTLNNLFPTACAVIAEKGNDGTIPYENGIGRIYYQIPKEEFLERQKNFEAEITNILNTYLKYDYSDFEKCLKLYDYMISNYKYDYGDITTPPNNGATYYCFISKEGICCDFGSLYAYLLLEANVDALLVSNTGLDHAWTYVIVDGEGYHIDPTWGLKSDYNNYKFDLDYFMMTYADREEDGDFPIEEFQVTLIPEFYAIDSSVDYSANSEKYSCFRNAYLRSIDTEKNIIYYIKFGEYYEMQYE